MSDTLAKILKSLHIKLFFVIVENSSNKLWHSYKIEYYEVIKIMGTLLCHRRAMLKLAGSILTFDETSIMIEIYDITSTRLRT